MTWVGTDEQWGPVSADRPDAPKSRWSWEAIFSLEIPHDLAVSPDGTTVAFILHRETSDVWTIPVTGGPATRVTTNRELTLYWDDTTPSWSPDGRHIAYVHDGDIWVVAVIGGAARKLTEAGSPTWIDNETLLVTVDGQTTLLAALSTEDARLRRLTSEDQNISGASVVAGGRAVVYENNPQDDRNATQIWWLDLESGESRRLTGVAGMHDFEPTVSPDGRRLAFVSERSGWYQLHLLDLVSGEERQVTHGPGDISAIEWHPRGDRLVAVHTLRGRSALINIFVDEGTITTESWGGTWSEPHWAGEAIVALYEGHLTPPVLLRVDPDGSTTPLLGPAPGEIQASPHSPFEEVTFRSFDGLEVRGFLYKPASTGDRPVPAVAYVHGGPTEAYEDWWDGVAQYFVDKGYAWFAINFRGSTGYGRDYERANHGVWGVDDTKDCLAAHDYLSGLGWVDPERIAIFGPSYGAYMALCAMTYDPDHRYRCAVLKYGDSDIATSWAEGDREGREDLERMMGTPTEAPEAYRAGSPIRSAANIAGPLLIVHGEQDKRVHPDQSARLAAELKRLGKHYEYFTYPAEAHGLRHRETNVHFHQRLERFLDWHLS